MDYLVEQFSRCSIKNDTPKEINNCEYCGRTQPIFLSAPYCDFIGVFICDDIKCKSRAMGDIYGYCIHNSHYPLTPSIISKFFKNMKVYNSDGFAVDGWSIRPYSFTRIEENEIIVIITNDPEFMFDEGSHSFVVTLRKLCEWNSLNIQDILNYLKHELDNFVFF